MGLGDIIFNFIGAVVRWIYGTTWRTIANKQKYKFNEYLNGPKNSNDWFDFTGHCFVNKIVGMITVVAVCWIIVFVI